MTRDQRRGRKAPPIADALGRARRCASVECAYCRDGCPSFIIGSLETDSPRGKNRVLAATMEERGPGGPAVARAVMECALCGRCEEVCLADADPFTSIPGLRAERAASGERSPLEEPAKRALDDGTPFGAKDVSWADGLPPSGRWGYFPGCNVLANRPDLARIAVGVMRANGHGPVPLTEICCGSPVYNAGMLEAFERNAAGLIDLMARAGVRHVVVSCPGCLNVLENLFPPSRVEFLHISEYLSRHPPVRDGRRLAPRRVAYHDPCNLARKCGVIDEPRAVLAALGCEVVEFACHGREAVCCGGGGGLARVEPERSRALALRAVEEALGLGVDAIVTCCLTCRDRLAREADGRVEVSMIEDLLPAGGDGGREGCG
ncbi:MAG: (Fe-S)-binding protein [Thermoplasmata archaeon]|nr:(Fe-S)-binding protein [Thermoplasmata archaeon]